MKTPIWSPQPVLCSTLALEEINRRLEKMQAVVDLDINLPEPLSTSTFKSEPYPSSLADLPYGNPSPSTLDNSDLEQLTHSISTPFLSLPRTPEYITEETAMIEQMMNPVSFQKDILDQPDAVYPMDSSVDSVQLENQSLVPPDHAFTHAFSPPQHQQNIYVACEGTNAPNRMNYDQTMEMENYTLASNIDNQSILVVQRAYEIKPMPVLVPVLNQTMAHTSSITYIIVPATLSGVMIPYIPIPMAVAVAPISMMKYETFAPPAEQIERRDIYYTPTPNTFLNSTPTDIYPLQEQEPPRCYYSSLSAALGPNPTVHANEYEPA